MQISGAMSDVLVALPSVVSLRSPEFRHLNTLCDSKSFLSAGLPKVYVPLYRFSLRFFIHGNLHTMNPLRCVWFVRKLGKVKSNVISSLMFNFFILGVGKRRRLDSWNDGYGLFGCWEMVAKGKKDLKAFRPSFFFSRESIYHLGFSLAPLALRTLFICFFFNTILPLHILNFCIYNWFFIWVSLSPLSCTMGKYLVAKRKCASPILRATSYKMLRVGPYPSNPYFLLGKASKQTLSIL